MGEQGGEGGGAAGEEGGGGEGGWGIESAFPTDDVARQPGGGCPSLEGPWDPSLSSPRTGGWAGPAGRKEESRPGPPTAGSAQMPTSSSKPPSFHPSRGTWGALGEPGFVPSDVGWPGNSWAGPRGPSKHLLRARAPRQGPWAVGCCWLASGPWGGTAGWGSPAPPCPGLPGSLRGLGRAEAGTGCLLQAPCAPGVFLGASVTPHSRLRPPSVGPSPRFSAEAQWACRPLPARC